MKRTYNNVLIWLNRVHDMEFYENTASIEETAIAFRTCAQNIFYLYNTTNKRLGSDRAACSNNRLTFPRIVIVIGRISSSISSSSEVGMRGCARCSFISSPFSRINQTILGPYEVIDAFY